MGIGALQPIIPGQDVNAQERLFDYDLEAALRLPNPTDLVEDCPLSPEEGILKERAVKPIW